MDDKKKEELVDAFVFASRPALSQRHRSDGWRWLAVRGNNNQISVVLPGERPAQPPSGGDEGQVRRKLVGQALGHVRRIGAHEMLRAWMTRTYGSPLLSQLTLAELRQAHREILSWRSAAG